MILTDQFDLEVLRLVNLERAKFNLNPLTLNEKLDIAADSHSARMASADFFSHVDPLTGSTMADRVNQTGYRWTNLGENIAAGQSTAREVVQGWMNSPGHRRNILNPNFTHMGLGYSYLNPDGGNVRYQHYWTQVFGAGSGIQQVFSRGSFTQMPDSLGENYYGGYNNPFGTNKADILIGLGNNDTLT